MEVQHVPSEEVVLVLTFSNDEAERLAAFFRFLLDKSGPSDFGVKTVDEAMKIGRMLKNIEMGFYRTRIVQP